MPQIEVTFEVDADGITSVSATDKMTGQEQAMKITPSSGLSASEIYDLIEEAQRNLDNDRRTKEVILARNRLEGLMQNTIRSFQEFGYMLSGADQETARRTIEDAREAALMDDASSIRFALEELENVAKMITDAMFRPTSVVPDAEANITEEQVAPLSELT